MNKNDLIAAIAEESGLSIRDARRALASILAEITAALARGESVNLVGFGSFGTRTRAARMGRNPRSGETIQIRASRVPYFKAAKALKDARNAGPGRAVPRAALRKARIGTIRRKTTAKKARSKKVQKRASRSMRPEEPLEMATGAEPEQEERRVNAEIRCDGESRNTFVCGKDNVIRCWIGLPQQGVSSSDSAIPEVDIPDDGLPLKVQMRWRGDSKSKWIILPADRTARTRDCDFTLHIPENERYISAEIIFRYEGSIFECVRLEAFAIAADQDEEAHHDVRLSSVLNAREVLEIEDRQTVNAALIWGEDRSEVTGPDAKGPTALRVFGSGSPEKFNLNEAGKAIDWLNDELFITEKSLVRKQAGAGDASNDAQIDGSDEEVIRILRTLAEHGTELYNQLTLQGFKDPGQRIQLINTEPEEYVPIEFVYDRGFPRKTAILCQAGLEALTSDAQDCPECKPASEMTLEERDGTDKICPFGFWSLSKIIERRDLDSLNGDTNNSTTGNQSHPNAERRSLPAIDNALFASSFKVPAAEREKTAAKLAGYFTKPGVALDWSEWKTLLKEKKPPLLVVLPHHHIESNQDFLEIGAQTVPEEDRLLNRGRMTDLIVNPTSADPGPIVILLGCRTAAETETGYVHLARRFQQLSTAIVMGTLAKILGRHAAPVARELVAELVSVSDPEADFGTIMLRVRRRMLARGYLMAMCLVALGDAEWRLTPRNTTTNNPEPSDVQH
jgi:nucleoid DNA-binding protein